MIDKEFNPFDRDLGEFTLHEWSKDGDFQALSIQDFLEFGVHEVAYIKPVLVEGRGLYAVHAANGAPLAVMETWEEAALATRMNDLEVISVQ